jgi:predicted enzyme related to lactoylglutathione lyase
MNGKMSDEAEQHLDRVVKEPYSMGDAPVGSIATPSDPDGNYFQLLSPM